MTIANYVTIISAVLVTILIMIQTRGASLGAGMGGGGEVNTVRRGSEKSLHNITIFMVLVFSFSLIANLIQI
ncbi:preprotein translocase subunit SecG [Candidatus Saccharibacteria bacterium]|nr:preprotein translocase subunit SecG [Candidatus Saccharibacteria bacterium]